MTGYSGTPLAKKLGLRDGMRAVLAEVPDHLEEITGFAGFAGLDRILTAGPRDCDYVHLFATGRIELIEKLPLIARRLKADGMLWISWPKKASKMPTDITEDVLRDIFLPQHLVDVKVCAIDDIWSGLKFMWRREHRANVI